MAPPADAGTDCPGGSNPASEPPLVYLAGAIEYAPDQGRGWRREIAPFLRERLGHRVYDPAEDERKSLTEEERRNLRAWKTSDLARFRKALRKVIAFDLEVVSKADYIVCLWDEYALKGGGTSAEVTFAHRRGIPVYLVGPEDLSGVSGWILACCEEAFPGFDQLKSFLESRYSSRSE